MGSSKNTHTTTLKKIGRLDEIIALGVLIIVMNLFFSKEFDFMERRGQRPKTWRSHVRANLSERNGKLFPVASTFLSHTYHQRILST